jgi:hypothetical protein
VDKDGNSAWGRVNNVPDGAGEIIAGLGSALWDIDRNGKTDLILAWAEGKTELEQYLLKYYGVRKGG